MPSPFPGMNPYLERPAIWHDFHGSFLFTIRTKLAAQLAPAYIVQFEETLFIHEESADERRFYASADVSVVGPTGGHRHADRGGTAVVEAPSTLRFNTSVIETKQRHLEILTREGRQLVTMIELLSPSNKRGEDRERYVDKRRQTLRAGANFVELDLLRGHGRVAPDGLATCDYYALVARREAMPDAGVWPLRLRDPLPTIPIPLRPPDPDATLDLQAVLHEVYDACRYDGYAYDAPPDPPLVPADQAWADECLAAAAVRAG